MDESRSRADSKLDEALEETFPASDPAANTVETGILTGESPSPPADAIADQSGATPDRDQDQRPEPHVSRQSRVR